MLRVLREGQAIGIRAVVAGDRGVLVSRVGAAMCEKLVLRLTDATDLLMAGIDSAAVPVHQPPGRALRVSDGVEMQLALLDGGAGSAAQAAALAAVARAGAAARAAFGGHVAASSRAPFRVDALPTRVALSMVQVHTAGTPMAWSRNGRRHQARQPRGVVGLGGDHNEVVGSSRLGQGANALVAGPPRSGRSTTLHTLAVQMLAAGRPVVVLIARRSPLSDLAGGDHAAPEQPEQPDLSQSRGFDRAASGWQATAAAGGAQAATPAVSAEPATAAGSAEAITPAAPLALLGPSDGEALAALAAAHPDLVAVVDDAELFLDTPAERPLLEIARRAEASGGGVLCAGTTAELTSMFRGLTVEVRKHRLGVLLHPGSYADGDLFGIRAPGGGDVVPGRGLFVDGVDVTPVQVALPA
jgi:S-DNA-T family DNA segregation ATPase FtsK/SpoIIIE